jgi:exopolyphosphatase/guanosine-5'-triphosphate,3'-diphosphate pyrophosphatase
VRVAVVDIGTNSTRLLVADVVDGRGTAVKARESIVTRLGQGVEQTKELSAEAMERVFAVLPRYRQHIDEHGAEATFAVLTSAVRDARNGDDFTTTIRERFGLDAHTIPGDEEAELTFLGATSERDPSDATPSVVIDIGGGSTEFVVGAGAHVDFHVSTQMGVVRNGERHLHSDPPTPAELDALRAGARTTIAEAVPAQVREATAHAIAVGGTSTWSASILHAERTGTLASGDELHGQTMSTEALRGLLTRLAAKTEDQRRAVRGLDPDRAPTIVAGVALLLESLQAFDLETVEVSEHDILRGAAIHRASSR